MWWVVQMDDCRQEWNKLRPARKYVYGPYSDRDEAVRDYRKRVDVYGDTHVRLLREETEDL